MVSRAYIKKRGLFFAGLWLAATLFAGPEDSPLYLFRSENHAAGGHRGRVNALVSVAAPVLDIAPDEDNGVTGDRAETGENADAGTTGDAGENAEDGEGADNETAGTGTEKEGTAKRYILTAGEDGYLGIWQQETLSAVERYQLSALPVSLMKAHPARSQIAYVESDGLAFHRLSVMDYWTKMPLFSLNFEDRITALDYTAGGSFLVVISGGRGLIYILDSETGKEARPQIAARAIFATASPSERTLVVYEPTGRISYWNLQSGRQTAEFPTTASLYGPVIFRNYNLLAGWVNNELVVINATNGRTLIRDRARAVPYGTLLPVAWDDEKFAVSQENGVTVYAISDSGAFIVDAVFPAGGSGTAKASDAAAASAISTASVISATSATATEEDGFFLGTEEGGLVHLDKEGGAAAFTTETQIRVTDALVYDETLFYITATGSRGKMPADYGAILNGAAITLPSRPVSGEPAIGFPVSELNGKLLYLEPQGPVVRATENGDPGRELLSVFLPLTIDADFADDENIIVAGMLSTGGSLLQLVNIATSETVPIEIPDDIVLKVYRGKSGSLYVAVSDGAGKRTRILKLDLRNPRQSRRLVEINAEDDIFDMAETGGILITSLGGETAGFYDTTRGNFLLSGERTGGIPARILDGGQSVIVIDDEGSVVWLDPATGRIQALMRIYPSEWEMSAAERRASGR